jgi:hypothetical protein
MQYFAERTPGGSGKIDLTGWKAIPTTPDRGETLEQALHPRSEFRRIADNVFPNETAMTFWVYPDSFPLYRGLRDYLHDRDVVVAGRPLPLDQEIAASVGGSVSRGQN